jgi:hypothetical protein
VLVVVVLRILAQVEVTLSFHQLHQLAVGMVVGVLELVTVA